jgi:hypothetical protein
VGASSAAPKAFEGGFGEVLAASSLTGFRREMLCPIYAAHAPVNLYTAPPHIGICIRSLVLSSHRLIAPIGLIYAGSCTWVSEKTTSRQLGE